MIQRDREIVHTTLSTLSLMMIYIYQNHCITCHTSHFLQSISLSSDLYHRSLYCIHKTVCLSFEARQLVPTRKLAIVRSASLCEGKKRSFSDHAAYGLVRKVVKIYTQIGDQHNRVPCASLHKLNVSNLSHTHRQCFVLLLERQGR